MEPKRQRTEGGDDDDEVEGPMEIPEPPAGAERPRAPAVLTTKEQKLQNRAVAERRVRKGRKGKKPAQKAKEEEKRDNYKWLSTNFTDADMDQDALVAGYRRTVMGRQLAPTLMGYDAAGMAKRSRAVFLAPSRAARPRAYYISGGKLMGGPPQVGESLGEKYSIPNTMDKTRELTTAVGKYVDPQLLPSTRIVKYVRGHWKNPRN